MNPTEKMEDKLQEQQHRFQTICEKMRKDASKFLVNMPEASSSSEEEDKDSMEIELINKTFCHYGDTADITQQTREYLQDALTAGGLICLICIEPVKKVDKTWFCNNCYCILHLDCTQKWASDSSQKASTENSKGNYWCCPKCRQEYPQGTLVYVCYCRKLENPSFDMWMIPHSCGQICDKKLKPDCSHTCSLLCHPGPCPACPKTVLISCCCGKGKPMPQRCSNKEWTCGKKCKKLLACGLHTCENLCHKGECSTCKKQSYKKCKCGNMLNLKYCHEQAWQCDKLCSKPLECGNHACNITCHEGPCPPCPDSGERFCPCKKNLVSLQCTVKVPPCGDTCGKLLECEMHKCTQRCHYGACELCLQVRLMKCRCGQKEKSVPCCKEFICDIKCKRKRNCGKHNCNRKCCSGNCPPCEAVCGKSLNCGNHKCYSVCHSGPCFPCREMVDIKCNCGLTKIPVSCGQKKSSVPPRCTALCRLPADCHHPSRQKHRCHFGVCPPCRLVCNKELSCGHKCTKKCHSAVLQKVNVKMEGPWDLKKSRKMELVSIPCSACEEPVMVNCIGGHEGRIVPCKKKDIKYSCGKLCGQVLECGNHTCEKECHVIPCGSDVEKLQNCGECQLPCGRPKSNGCIHPCPSICHKGLCKPCVQSVKLSCYCKVSTWYMLCYRWEKLSEEEKAKTLSCSNRCPKEILCGHQCQFECHPGLCSSADNCKKRIKIYCPCKRKKKDIQCFSLKFDQISLICDDVCLEQQQTMMSLELEKKAKDDELERISKDKELQAFLRKTEGKKKKKKKFVEQNSSGWSLKIFWKIITVIFGCVFIWVVIQTFLY